MNKLASLKRFRTSRFSIW